MEELLSKKIITENINWYEIEEKLSCKLPNDYKEIIGRLGAFEFENTCIFYSPASGSIEVNTFEREDWFQKLFKDYQLEEKDTFESYNKTGPYLIEQIFSSKSQRLVILGRLFFEIDIIYDSKNNYIWLTDYYCEERLDMSFKDLLKNIYNKSYPFKIFNIKEVKNEFYFYDSEDNWFQKERLSKYDSLSF